MRIIKPSRIREFQSRYPKAAANLSRWLELVESHRWANIKELHQVFPHADTVRVNSNRVVTVFNICRHNFRLITAIHYNRGIVYVLLFMSHAEYSKDVWKESL